MAFQKESMPQELNEAPKDQGSSTPRGPELGRSSSLLNPELREIVDRKKTLNVSDLVSVERFIDSVDLTNPLPANQVEEINRLINKVLSMQVVYAVEVNQRMMDDAALRNFDLQSKIIRFQAELNQRDKVIENTFYQAEPAQQAAAVNKQLAIDVKTIKNTRIKDEKLEDFVQWALAKEKEVWSAISRFDEFQRIYSQASFTREEVAHRQSEIEQFQILATQLKENFDKLKEGFQQMVSEVLFQRSGAQNASFWNENPNFSGADLDTLSETARNAATEYEAIIERVENLATVAGASGRGQSFANVVSVIQQRVHARYDSYQKKIFERWRELVNSKSIAKINEARALAQRLTQMNDADFTADMYNDLDAAKTDIIALPVLNQYQKDYLQEQVIKPLDSLLDRVQAQLRKRGEVVKAAVERVPSSMKIAIGFFEENPDIHGHPEWEKGGWRNATAAELTMAVMKLIEYQFFKNSRKHEPYLGDQHLFQESIQNLHDHPNISGLVTSLKAFGFYYEQLSLADPANKDAHHRKSAEIGEFTNQLAEDIAETDKIFRIGLEIRNSFGDMDRIAEAVRANALDALDIQRVFRMGKGYMDTTRVGDALGVKNGRALQMMFMVNEPIYHKYAVFSERKANGEARVVMGINETNPLTFFPEQKADKKSSDLRILKRLLIQIIAGESDSPPWMRADNRDFAERMAEGQQYFVWRLYGDPADRNNVNYSEKNYHGESIYGRYVSAGSSVDDVSLFLSETEQAARRRGYISEGIAYNLMVASLEIGKASAAKMRYKEDGTLDTQTVDGVSYPVIDAQTGPLGEVMVDRIENTTAYRTKVTGQEGGEGEGGPAQSLDYLYSAVRPTFDYYSYYDEEDEVGRNLKDKIVSLNDDELQTSTFTNYMQASSTETKPWAESVGDGIKFYQWYVKRLGIKYASLKSYLPGSEGLTPTFNLDSLEIIKIISRKVHYILTRDYGKDTAGWDTDKQYKAYRAVEDVYVEKTMQQGIRDKTVLLNPDNYPTHLVDANGGKEQFRKLLKSIRKNLSTPTDKHELYDIKPTKNEISYEPAPGFKRFAIDAHTMHRIATELPEQAHSGFEKVVLKTSSAKKNDAYVTMKKLIVGNILINDLAVNAVGMSIEDAMVFIEFLSKRNWEALHNSPVMKLTRWFGFGRERDYQGLGYFSEEEAQAILKEAGVSSNVIMYAQYALEQLNRFYTKK